MNCKVIGKVRKHHLICRVCLKNVNKTGMSVFQNFMNLPVYRHILSIVTVNIRANDGFPDKICSQCLKELKVAVCFKKKCEENDKVLQTSTFKTSTENSAKSEATEIMYTHVEKEEQDDSMFSDSNNFDARQTFEREGSTTLFHSTQIIDEETHTKVYTEDDKTLLKDLLQKPQLKSEPTVEMFDDTSNDKKPLVPKSEDEQEEDVDNFNRTQTTESYVTNDDDDHSGRITPKSQFKSRAIDLRLQCDDCKDFFKSKCKLRVHWKKVHMRQKHIICEWCKRDFKGYKSYHSHRKNRPKHCKEATNFRIEGFGKSRIIYCKECNYSVKARQIQYMIKHKYTHSGEKPYECEKCEKRFSQVSPLIAHKETAHGEYKIEITCQYCGKMFRGRYKAYQHLKTHTSENFKCKICSKILKSRKSLKHHLLRHTGIKNFQCEFCAETFFTSSNLYLHNKRKHFEHFGAMLKHECDLCGYKTSKKAYILTHRLKHAGDNVACNECGRFFDSKQELEVHERRHYEKNHVCDHCNRPFYRKHNLRKHIQAKHLI